MDKIKVLQMFAGNAKGGRTQYMLNNWKYINRSIFQFDFATLSKKLDFAEQLEAEGCKIHYVSCYAEENYEQFVSEIDDILSLGYDIVHIHFAFWRSFIIEERARLAGVKKIILHAHSVGISGVKNGETQFLEREHFRLREVLNQNIADYFWACSKEAAEWLYGSRIAANKIHVVRNGIDLDRYKYDFTVRESIRRKLGLNNQYVIGNVGRFSYEKNQEFLIDVVETVCRELRDVVLLLVGVGELEGNIRQKVKALGIENKVTFLGKRNDVPELLQAMDLFVLPSRFEGFPLSLLEAQASALPCIAGNVPEEASLNERTYLLALDKEKWVETILKEYGLHNRVVINKEALAYYDIRNQVKEIEKLYLE